MPLGVDLADRGDAHRNWIRHHAAACGAVQASGTVPERGSGWRRRGRRREGARPTGPPSRVRNPPSPWIWARPTEPPLSFHSHRDEKGSELSRHFTKRDIPRADKQMTRCSLRLSPRNSKPVKRHHPHTLRWLRGEERARGTRREDPATAAPVLPSAGQPTARRTPQGEHGLCELTLRHVRGYSKQHHPNTCWWQSPYPAAPFHMGVLRGVNTGDLYRTQRGRFSQT